MAMGRIAYGGAAPAAVQWRLWELQALDAHAHADGRNVRAQRLRAKEGGKRKYYSFVAGAAGPPAPRAAPLACRAVPVCRDVRTI